MRAAAVAPPINGMDSPATQTGGKGSTFDDILGNINNNNDGGSSKKGGIIAAAAAKKKKSIIGLRDSS